MRILMVAPQPFREARGTPISVYQRLHGLSALGHVVDLATYPLGEDVNIRGVTLHRGPSLPFLKQVRVGPSWLKLLLDFLLFWRVAIMMVRKRYDAIHSHEEAAFFCMLLGALFRTRHVYDMHSSLPLQLANFGFGHYRPIVSLFSLLERWVIGSCDAVITIGPDLEEHVKATNPRVNQVRIDNLPVQAIGVATDERSVLQIRQRHGLDGRLAVVYTGTLERYQGVDLLLESAEIVKKCRPEVAFLVIGGKPQQVEHWKARTREAHLDDCVHFTGSVSLEEAAAYMEMAEILVSPRTGGISVPLKIYSYLLAGKPVVATNLPTHTMVLNEETAVLVDPTREELAAGLIKLIQDPGLRRRLGLQARRFAEQKFPLEDYLAKLDALYRAVVAEGDQSGRSLPSRERDLASPGRAEGAVEDGSRDRARVA